MDQGVINVDFNFGEKPISLGEEQLFSKASPSHDSDSGLSTMGSPCHSTSSLEGEEQSYNLMDELDTELASYLSTPDQMPLPDPDVLGFVCGTNNNDKENEIDALNTPSASPKGFEKSKNLSPKVVLNKLPSTSFQPFVSKSTAPASVNVPKAVKVIKVIKTPATTSSVETDKQIFEALDDRNKKNAVQAKINREKKKAYIKALEDDVETLKSENELLKQNQNSLELSKKCLEEEVEYLKSVLANQSVLSGLLKNIPNVNNVKLSSSFSCKRSAEHDHDYQEPSRKRTKTNTAGVCLHVDKDSVSLEFCSQCSKSAKMSEDGTS